MDVHGGSSDDEWPKEPATRAGTRHNARGAAAAAAAPSLPAPSMYEEGLLYAAQDESYRAPVSRVGHAVAPPAPAPAILAHDHSSAASLQADSDFADDYDVGPDDYDAAGDDEFFESPERKGRHAPGKRSSSLSSGRKRTRQPGAAPDSADKRTENTLGSLTQRFVALVKNAQDGVMDLNKAAEMLDVRKRRVYDITNVLEGVGLIDKTSKNMVQWKGSGFATADEKDRLEELQVACRGLMRKEEVLDTQVSAIQTELRSLGEDSVTSTLAYVTYDDVRGLPQFRDQAVLAIKAPPNTRLEVPDPDDGMPPGQRRYQIHLLNAEGNPIFAYLLTADRDPVPAPASAPQDPSVLVPRMPDSRGGAYAEDDIPSDMATLFDHDPSGLLSAVAEHPNYGLGIMSSFEGVTEIFRFD